MLNDVSKQFKRLVTFTLFLLLTACGGGTGEEDESTSSSSQSSTNNTTKPVITSSSKAASSVAPDVTPPTGTNLQLYKISSTSIILKWQPSTDNVAVSSYEIRRNGLLIASANYPTSSAMDSDLTPNTSYSYTITTVDSSGNRSATSPTFTVKTLLGQITNSSSSSSDDGSIVMASSSSNSSSANSDTGGQRYSWSHPSERQNGDFLELDAIGGYEIRFKPSPNDEFIYLNIEGNRTTSISTDLIPQNSNVEISAYDINGLYSRFVSIRPE